MQQTESEPKIKRRPGRPRKTPIQEPETKNETVEDTESDNHSSTTKRRHSSTSSIHMHSNKKARLSGMNIDSL